MTAPERAVSHAFPPAARLHRPSEFAPVLKGARIARGDLFMLSAARVTPDTTQETARLGLIIAKRHARRSVTRNALKRVLREAFRHQRSRLPARDFVFRLHANVDTELSLTQLKRQARAEADRLLRKAQRQ